MPVQFSATGLGTHSEGYVVEFLPDSELAWVGNFQPGGSTINDVIIDDDRDEALVIAGGQGYLVDVPTAKLVGLVGGFIQDAIELPDQQGVVFSDGTDFELFRSGEVLWRTRRLSWDGFRNIVVEGQSLTGEAWMFDDTWHPFSVNLRNGEASGGSYVAV